MARFTIASGPWALVTGVCAAAALAAVGYVVVSRAPEENAIRILDDPAVQPDLAQGEAEVFAPDPDTTEEETAALAPGPDETEDEQGERAATGAVGTPEAATEDGSAPATGPEDASTTPESAESSTSEETVAEEENELEARPEDPITDDQDQTAGETASAFAPSFDLVRAEADGQVLVAGRAGPQHSVRLEVDGAEMAVGAADATGDFVLFVFLDVSDKARVLDLISVDPNGREYQSEESVILAPPPAPVAAADDDPDEDLERTPLDGVGTSEVASATQTGERTTATEAGTATSSNAAGAVASVDAPAVSTTVSQGDQLAGARADLAADVASETPAGVEAEPSAAAVSQVAEGPADSQPVERAPAIDVASATSAAAQAAANSTAEIGISGAAQPPEAQTIGGTATAAVPVDATKVADVLRAPAVLVARDAGVSLLQPARPSNARLDRVVIDVISYDALGTVTLEGRSAAPPPPIDRVRIYLDNTAVETTKIDTDGTWRLPLRDVDSGVYTLRVDQLDRDGNVVSRFETPFKREDPVNLARLEAERPEPDGTLEVSVITVQPGYTLWGIASDRYGDGFNYVAIFDANADQIRDPDLIYPGQVFDLPELESAN